MFDAIEANDYDKAYSAIKAGADVNCHYRAFVLFPAIVGHNSTPLIDACYRNSDAIISLLLDQGADVNLCDNLEAAPAWLIEACSLPPKLSSPDIDIDEVLKNKEQKNSESLFSVHEYLGEKIFVRNHEVHISKSLLGEAYAIFDMNGKLIQKGIAGEIIRMPTSPSILKIGARKPFLCK